MRLLLGGSPCTHWSVAQTKGRETKAEGLGWELFRNFLIAKEKFQPDFFLYENNKSAAPAIKEQIAAELGYPLQYINSALFSAQTRHRFYVHNFGEVELPKSCDCTVADILEQGVPYKDGKGYALDVRYYEGKQTGGLIDSSKSIRVGTVKNKKDKISTTQSSRVFSPNGKACTQCAGGGGMGARTGLYLCPVTEDEKVSPKYRVNGGLAEIEGIKVQLPVADGLYAVRKLTVKEATRLQTLPDDYCKAAPSASKAYHGLGNGWTAEVIIHLLRKGLEGVDRDEELQVLSMYDGIGTGRYCLEQLGFTNVKYWAYEIEPSAIQIATSNFPDIVECGDAFAVRQSDWTLPSIR